MTAEEVKDALRRRHPALSPGSQMVGEWVVIEEWQGIDLLALSAWNRARRVGYEVKVSRGDYRKELLVTEKVGKWGRRSDNGGPSKRAQQVAMCHHFYFAVPKGLLKPEEIAFQPSEWEDGDYRRERCPERCRKPSMRERQDDPYLPRRGSVEGERVPVPCTLRLYERAWYEHSENLTEEERQVYRDRDLEQKLHNHGWTYRTCRTCGGKGYTRGALVEREAPYLWVPLDVGLIEVSGRGCSVVKPAPRNDDPQPLVYDSDQALHQLVRWVSARPDPRHERLRR